MICGIKIESKESLKILRRVIYGVMGIVRIYCLFFIKFGLCICEILLIGTVSGNKIYFKEEIELMVVKRC